MVPVNLVSKTDEDISYYKLFFSQEFRKELERAKTTAKKYKGLEVIYPTLNLEGGFKTCTQTWNYFYISWDGLLPPCCAKPFPKELNFGNVFKNGVMNSINSKRIKAFRKLWIKNETPEFCKKCILTTNKSELKL